MILENTFVISAPIEHAWAALNDPEVVAPCFPGASLDSYEADSFTGTVKVKLGPISLTYKGKGTYVSRDEEGHAVVIKASGRDSRGNGTADATVTGTMMSDGPDQTRVSMSTDMAITGRAAQFGRGVINDVADTIIGRFADCLAATLAEQQHRESGPTSVPSRPAAEPSAQARPAVDARPAAEPAAAVSLLHMAAGPILKRIAPLVAIATLALLLWRVQRLRRSR